MVITMTCEITWINCHLLFQLLVIIYFGILEISHVFWRIPIFDQPVVLGGFVELHSSCGLLTLLGATSAGWMGGCIPGQSRWVQPNVTNWATEKIKNFPNGIYILVVSFFRIPKCKMIYNKPLETKVVTPIYNLNNRLGPPFFHCSNEVVLLRFFSRGWRVALFKG